MIHDIPEKGLVVSSPYIERILSGEKTWEMRSTRTATRGSIALIKKGSGTVVGLAKLVSVKGPLTHTEMLANVDKHRRNSQEINDPELKKRNIAWVLSDIRRLNAPIPYNHNSGAVIWVKLDDDVRKKIADQIGSVFIRANRIFETSYVRERTRLNQKKKKVRKVKNNHSDGFYGLFGLVLFVILAANFGFINTIIFFAVLGAIMMNPRFIVFGLILLIFM